MRQLQATLPALLLLHLAACTPGAQRSTPRQSLSPQEQKALATLQPDQSVSIALVSSTGEIRSSVIRAGDFDETGQDWLNADPGATLALDLPLVAHFEGGAVDEALLYSGKEEFGLDEWARLYPLADGRGVKIGVADDGVALARPGLTQTSTGDPKIIRSISPSSVWNVAIQKSRPDCVPESESARKIDQWNWQDSGLAPIGQAELVLPFDITSCGSPQSGAPLSRRCADWSKLLSPELKTTEGRFVIHAVLLEFAATVGSKQLVIAADLNGDSQITHSEVFEPLSTNPRSHHLFATGEALAFDVHEFSKAGPMPKSCAQPEVGGRYLNIITPELAGNSHGEGVASVAAGHRIAGRNFDGVAPGATIVDVRFSDPVGTEAYSISELARILRIAGLHSDLVNLSFSLFFSSPTAQVAMNRVLESALKDTAALYFFSAGNNGPGRGSMNRALIYPSMGIPVGAWLNGRMSQTVFGSTTPLPGVVSYSSRGPGPDGFGGALLLSPLAAMAAGPAGDGVRSFSGTSSATPALTGLAARVLSQIRSEGLSWSRDRLKQSLVEGAVSVESTPFIDQGFGIPRLARVMEAYRRLSQEKSPLPSLKVTGENQFQGIPQRGIYARGERQRLSRYGFRIEAEFAPGTPEQQIADYAENLKFEASSPWIRIAPYRLLGRSSLRIEIAPDWNALEQAPGEHLGDVRIINSDTGTLRAIIPVTLLVPEAPTQALDRTLELRPNEIRRVFVQPPSWAQSLLVSIESDDPDSPLCGQTSLYDPVGVRQSSTAGQNTAYKREQAFAIRFSGVYEWIMDAGRNHSSCPFSQKLRMRMQWIGIDSSLLDAEFIDSDKHPAEARLRLVLHSQAPLTRGTLRLHRPGVERRMTLVPESSSFTWRSAEPIDITETVNRFRFTKEFERKQSLLLGYHYLGLLFDTGNRNLEPASLAVVDGWWQMSDLNSEEAPTRGHLLARSFDLGLPAEKRPGPVELIHRTEKKDAGRIESKSIQIEVRSGNEELITVSVPGNAEELSGRSLLCTFTPAGWNVGLACPHVGIP